jgi:heptosyltransferase III
MGQSLKHIIISRIDAIGDVILTLPVAGYLKQLFPEIKITFLGNTYTEPILKYCTSIDQIIDFTKLQSLSESQQIALLQSIQADAIIHVFPNPIIAGLAKKAGIPTRIGTNRRLFHWHTCNQLINLSRKKSQLHEAELNLKLLKGLGISVFPDKHQIKQLYHFKAKVNDMEVLKYIDANKTNIILHTKSKGSAREWGLDHFAELIDSLKPEDYNILLTGTEAEGQLYRDALVKPFPHVKDTSGQLDLSQLVQLIQASQVLIAASTGPLHIASALGKKAIGLYAPMRPLFPQRWGPLGGQAHALAIKKNCDDCRKTKDCVCIRSIAVDNVLQVVKA